MDDRASESQIKTALAALRKYPTATPRPHGKRRGNSPSSWNARTPPPSTKTSRMKTLSGCNCTNSTPRSAWICPWPRIQKPPRKSNAGLAGTQTHAVRRRIWITLKIRVSQVF